MQSWWTCSGEMRLAKEESGNRRRALKLATHLACKCMFWRSSKKSVRWNQLEAADGLRRRVKQHIYIFLVVFSVCTRLGQPWISAIRTMAKNFNAF